MMQFWKAQVQLLVFYILMISILALLVVLYQLPGEAVWLCFWLSLPVLGSFLGYRWHQYRKVRDLMAMDQFDSSHYPGDVVPYAQKLEEMQKKMAADKEKAFVDRRELVDYFSLWAHQTKLPLAVLRLLCEQDYPDTRAIRMQMKRLTQYVDMAMAFVRLESDSDYKLKTQPVDLMIREAVRGFSTEFIHKKLKLEYTETHRQAITDSKWMTFVLEQVLSNAVRYTPEGGTIRIYGSGNTICIQDTGCGIDPADLPRIFDQGFSGFNGHASSTSSGVGLYLCKKVLDRLGHTIEIQSVLGKGTKVIIGISQNQLLMK